MSQSDPNATQPQPDPQGFAPWPPAGVPQATPATPQPMPPVENPAVGFGIPPVPLDTPFSPAFTPQPSAIFQPEQTVPQLTAPETLVTPAVAWPTPAETTPTDTPWIDNSGTTFAAVTPHDPAADIMPPQPTTPTDQPWLTAPTDQTYAPGQPPTTGQPPYAAIPGQDYTTQPGQPYAPGYLPQMPPQKKKHTARNALIIVLAILLVAGGIFAYWWFAMRDNGIRGGRATDDPVAAGQATTAQAAVRGYLQALAAGNSADALSFAAAPPASTTFLTDAVLQASLALNPITFQQAVREDLSNKDDITVTATYQIGTQQVSATYQVDRAGDSKYYFVNNATTTVNLSNVYVDGVGMALNGTSLGSSKTAELFPGTYQLTINNSLLTLTGGQFTITDPSSSPSLLSTTVELVPDAQSQFADTAKTTLDNCMAEKSLQTSCGFGTGFVMTNDFVFRDVDTSTIQWTFTRGSSNDLTSTNFQYYPQDNPTKVSASINLQVRMVVNGEGADADYYFLKCYDFTAVNIDFSDPANLATSFSASAAASCPSPYR